MKEIELREAKLRLVQSKECLHAIVWRCLTRIKASFKRRMGKYPWTDWSL